MFFCRLVIKILKKFIVFLEVKIVKMVKLKTIKEINAETPGQTFSNKKPQYFLDEVTDTLERLPNDMDIQEYIDSQKDCALKSVLDRFISNDFSDEYKDIIADYTDKRVDLSVIGQAMEIAEDFREENGLSDDLSVKDLYNFMNDKAVELEKKLKEGLKKDVEKKEID